MHDKFDPKVNPLPKPKPTGPDTKKRPLGEQKHGLRAQNAKADAKYAHRGAAQPWQSKGKKPTSTIANEPEVPGPRVPPLATGPGYDGSKGYAVGNTAGKGYTKR
jgi:hypothetical protein